MFVDYLWSPEQAYRGRWKERRALQREVKDLCVREQTGDLGLASWPHCATLGKKVEEVCWLGFLSCNQRFGSLMTKVSPSSNFFPLQQKSRGAKTKRINSMSEVFQSPDFKTPSNCPHRCTSNNQMLRSAFTPLHFWGEYLNLRMGKIFHFGRNEHSYRKIETSWESIKRWQNGR